MMRRHFLIPVPIRIPALITALVLTLIAWVVRAEDASVVAEKSTAKKTATVETLSPSELLRILPETEPAESIRRRLAAADGAPEKDGSAENTTSSSASMATTSMVSEGTPSIGGTLSIREIPSIGAATRTSESLSARLHDLAMLVRPSVVQIEVRIAAPEGSGMPTILEKGSGVLVCRHERTVVLTNHHVLQNSPKERIRIRMFGGEWLQCNGILSDPETDMAVLTFVGENPRVRTAETAEVPANIGDFVCSFGHPFGLEQSLAAGVVGGLGRCQLNLAGGTIRYQYFIQSDAPINPGSSGGPLVNLRGEVVGLSTGIASSSGGNNGIGFAIPIHLVWRVADQLLMTGSVRRGWVGVRLAPAINPEILARYGLNRPVGALVATVDPDSPAAAAGLRPGDLLLRYDGDLLERAEHLTMLAPFSPPGVTVPVDFLRETTLLRAYVTVTERNP